MYTDVFFLAFEFCCYEGCGYKWPNYSYERQQPSYGKALERKENGNKSGVSLSLSWRIGDILICNTRMVSVWLATKLWNALTKTAWYTPPLSSPPHSLAVAHLPVCADPLSLAAIWNANKLA